MVGRIPSDRYLTAIQRDLERLEREVNYYTSQIPLYERDMEIHADDPERVAEDQLVVATFKEYRDDFATKLTFRAFEMLLFSQGRFDLYGGIVAAIFLNDDQITWMERAMRVDPDLLEGDAIFFGGH